MEDWDSQESGDVRQKSQQQQQPWLPQSDEYSRQPAFGRGRARNRDEETFGSRARSDGPPRGGGGWSRRGRDDRGDDSNWRSREPRGGGFTSNRRTEMVNVNCDSVGRIIGTYS